MGNAGMWATYALIAALAVVPVLLASLSTWRPWEIIALVALLAPTGAAAAWAWAWYTARVRQIELAALSSDDQAARLLGEALGRCGSVLTGALSKEVWDAFASLPSESKRALALAITGFVTDSDQSETFGFGAQLVGIVRGFRGPVAVPEIASDEQAARAFGDALGQCVRHLNTVAARELWDTFAALPSEAKRELASALSGFVATADLDHGGDIGKHLLALAHSFQLAPEPAHAP